MTITYFLYAILLFLVIIPREVVAEATRNEVSRYTVLRDRLIIDRSLRKKYYWAFFDFDITSSSGLKSLIGDVKDQTQDTEGQTAAQNQTAKELNIYKLITQNANSEKYLDADVILGIPLPWFSLWGIEYRSSLFFNLNFGISFSFANREDALNPVAQTYIKKDQKMGLFVKTGDEKKERWELAVYQLTRSDSYNQLSYNDIANSRKLFSFDGLATDVVSWAADIRYTHFFERTSYLLEVQELSTSMMSGDDTISYGHSPLLHGRFVLYYSSAGWSLRPFVGIHYRKRYPLADGVYVGMRIIGPENIPFHFSGKISNDFLAIMPQLKTKYFNFTYSLKLAYRNPQDDMWVPALHTIAFNFPFPWDVN